LTLRNRVRNRERGEGFEGDLVEDEAANMGLMESMSMVISAAGRGGFAGEGGR